MKTLYTVITFSLLYFSNNALSQQLEPIILDYGDVDSKVSLVAFSDDENLIVTAGEDFIIWDGDTYEKKLMIEKMQGKFSHVVSVDISANNKYILFGGMYKAILYSIADKKVFHEFEDASYDAISFIYTSVGFSLDNSKAYIFDSDDHLQIFDVNTGKKIRLIRSINGEIADTIVSLNNNFIVFKSSDDYVWGYNIENEKQIYYEGRPSVLSLDRTKVYGIDFSRSTDEYVYYKIYTSDVFTGEVLNVSNNEIRVPKGNYHVMLSPDAQFALYQPVDPNEGNQLTMQKIDNNIKLTTFNIPYKSYEYQNFIHFSFSPSMKKLALNDGNKVRIYDISDLTTRISDAIQYK